MPNTEKKPISNAEFMRQMEEMTNAFNKKHNVLEVNREDELELDEAIATFVPKTRDPKGPFSWGFLALLRKLVPDVGGTAKPSHYLHFSRLVPFASPFTEFG